MAAMFSTGGAPGGAHNIDNRADALARGHLVNTRPKGHGAHGNIAFFEITLRARAHFVKRLCDAADTLIQRTGLRQAFGNLPLMLGQRLPRHFNR